MYEIHPLLKDFNESIAYADSETQSSKFFKVIEKITALNETEMLKEAENEKEFLLKIALSVIIYLAGTGKAPQIESYEKFIETKDFISQLALNTNPQLFDMALEVLLTPNADGVISDDRMMKAFLICTTETKKFAKYQSLLAQDQNLYINTLFSFIYSCSGTNSSSSNRDYSMELLKDIDIPFECLPLFIINGVIMNSSYAFTESKDLYKRKINESIRNVYKKFDVELALRVTEGKKTVFVVLEVFNMQHSVYRVLGQSIKILRERFKVIGICWPGIVSHVPDSIFDELLELKGNPKNFSCDELRELSIKYSPCCVYYPSIGMAQYGIIWSNIRLAEVQIVGIGHGGSSYATEIDYFVIEEDIAGDQATYSEKLVRLPPGSMPYYPPVGIEYTKRAAIDSHQVSICCVATSMKLNSSYLEVCSKILENAQKSCGLNNVCFNFYIGSRLSGLKLLALKKLIKHYLPTATIYPQQTFQSYIDALSQNTLMLTPFPFGGMNGLIDCAKLGIPAICLAGKFVHEAFDAGMWTRMGFETELVADTIESYIKKADAIIANSEFRRSIQSRMEAIDLNRLFFEEPSLCFPNLIEQLCNDT